MGCALDMECKYGDALTLKNWSRAGHEEYTERAPHHRDNRSAGFGARHSINFWRVEIAVIAVSAQWATFDGVRLPRFEAPSHRKEQRAEQYEVEGEEQCAARHSFARRGVRCSVQCEWVIGLSIEELGIAVT